MLSDGKMRSVHYSIIEDGGFAGFGQGVEWCVTGLDRNWAYSPGAGPRGPHASRIRLISVCCARRISRPPLFVLEMFRFPARLRSVEYRGIPCSDPS